MKRTVKKIGCLLLSLALLLTLLPVSVLAVETDTAKIMADAFALTSGEWLPYEATLTGKVIKVDQVYSSQYKNITVTIEVPGYPDKPIKCYRMVGTGTDEVDIGYTITVSGYITNYNGTVEFTKKDDVKCQLVEIVDRGVLPPEDPRLIVDAAFALAPNESLPYTATLVGEVVEIVTPYDYSYKNMTLNLQVEGSDGMKIIECYRMKGEGVDTIEVGDWISVTGIIEHYYKDATEEKPEVSKIEFVAGCVFTFCEDGLKVPSGKYYLVGYLNGADYFGNDYQFLNGKLTMIFETDSYVFIKDAEGISYMTESYCHEALGTFVIGGVEKMWVPGDVELTFTLTENADGTMTLSYNLDDNIMDDDAESVYRVVGNADWMGNWDPASDAGQLEEVSPGFYKQKFENVQPGNYEMKITKNGSWNESWGDNGANFCFAIKKTCDITVTFTLNDGYGTISVKGTGLGPVDEDPSGDAFGDILDEAYALEEGAMMPYDVTLTGRIVEINSPYSEQYRNITVTIAVAGHADKPVVCYRLKGEGVETLSYGMTITVIGRFHNYRGTIEFDAGCVLVDPGCRHNYKLTIIPATCTKGSYEAQVCTLCGDMDPDSISKETSAPLGHSYETQVVSPTCTKEGYAVHTCVVCGDSYTGGKTPARGHQLSDYSSDGNATCTGDGTKTSVCRLCGLTKTLTDEGSALGHSFTHYRYDYNALCQQDGTETAKCDRCAETDTRTRSGSSLEHLYVDGSCEHCGQKEENRLLGDLTGDNKLNIMDVAKLYALVRSGEPILEEQLTYADMTGDGKINVIDVAKLYAQIKSGG